MSKLTELLDSALKGFKRHYAGSWLINGSNGIWPEAQSALANELLTLLPAHDAETKLAAMQAQLEVCCALRCYMCRDQSYYQKASRNIDPADPTSGYWRHKNMPCGGSDFREAFFKAHSEQEIG